MKQYFLFFLVLITIPAAQCISQFSQNALSDLSARGQTKRRATLTDTQYQKERRLRRQERHAQKALERERNAKAKTKKLTSFYHHTDAHRTTADHAEKSRQFCRGKAKTRRDRKEIVAQKKVYTQAQQETIEKRINVHNAARNALLKQL